MLMEQLEDGAQKVDNILEEECGDLFFVAATRVFSHLLHRDPTFDFNKVMAPFSKSLVKALQRSWKAMSMCCLASSTEVAVGSLTRPRRTIATAAVMPLIKRKKEKEPPPSGQHNHPNPIPSHSIVAAPRCNLAAWSSTVHLFTGDPLAPRPRVTVCKDTAAFSPSFRCDGALLAAGDGRGVVRVFHVDKPTAGPLRTLSAHVAQARVVRYPEAGGDKVHLLTAGDDALLAYWDVTSETPVFTVPAAHRDYIRASVPSPVDHSLFIKMEEVTKRMAQIENLNEETNIHCVNHSRWCMQFS
ncbi:protein SLOW WALKER 1-like [Triticum dicoccoides]|uniref:protein SLOW WALKER 1-like n=1 Tax=Triticum dicoccoides TaxID=85692 RepID=UPI00188FD471|nr:protein SLOW WALKER 1-like [Triticum dicoccoides]